LAHLEGIGGLEVVGMVGLRKSGLWGIALIVIVGCSLFAQGKYGGGSGTEEDPYQIWDANQMQAIGADANDWDKCFKLMADIDLSQYDGQDGREKFNVIGEYVGYNDPKNKPFEGVFNGNGHTISNFTYTSTDIDNIGFFEYVEDGEVKNLGLIDPNVDAGTGSNVGSLVGWLWDSTITNCYADGGSVVGYGGVGGLVGINGWCDRGGMCYSGMISNCYSTGCVSGYRVIGGLVGKNNDGTIYNCYSDSIVSGTTNVGGLLGINNEGTISNSYSNGDVSGNVQVGGLVGTNYWQSIVYNSYSSGNVSGDYEVGGLVGAGSGKVSVCFWDVESSGQTISAGGTGKTTTEMQSASTFLGWECDLVWTIDDGNDYPRLWWEKAPGKAITPELYLGGGSGEVNNPYLIYTAEQLNMIGLFQCIWDKHFKLMADIDLGDFKGTSYNIIGYFIDHDNYKSFTGVFDGNGHTISNFSYTSTDKSYIGIFGYVNGSDAIIKELRLIDPNVDAGTGRSVGSLVGSLRDGTIIACYTEGASVSGDKSVGGLVGGNGGIIAYSYSTGNVMGNRDVGGLVGYNSDNVSNSHSISSVNGKTNVGGLLGSNSGTTNDCCSKGDVLGDEDVGGLVGYNIYGIITNCYVESSSVSSKYSVGGLVGCNGRGKINNCYSTIPVSGTVDVGGLVGNNIGTITNCYSTGSVSGEGCVGGLVAFNYVTITNCYSTSSVVGEIYVGGLVGNNPGGAIASFWDIETSGQTTSDGGTGLPTAQMEMQTTFTDVGWDFNTPIWTIEEGIDYPHLWCEYIPTLHTEPDITLGTTNTISWEPITGNITYYAECSTDANFTNIAYNSGWITETSYEFTNLTLGQQFWYSVKVRNSAGIESQWSNVESSLQCSLSGAVETLLTPENLKNENMKNALLNKIDEALEMINRGNYKSALNKLQNDILQKTNGCAEIGEPDKNDWIITCEEQSEIYPLIIETIEHVKSLME
jgi:hypothetical protein